MSKKNESEQLKFWRGDFGADYISRNTAHDDAIRARVALWARIMAAMEGRPPRSILEVEANIGLNLRALRHLTDARLGAVEPNDVARSKLVGDRVLAPGDVHDGYAASLPFEDASFECVFTSGVLIHVSPEELGASISEISRVAHRYIVCIEYFSDSPVELNYRGHSERLFKRDFGQFYLDNIPDIRVLDYGFAWKATTCLDSLTWWVFEKNI